MRTLSINALAKRTLSTSPKYTNPITTNPITTNSKFTTPKYKTPKFTSASNFKSNQPKPSPFPSTPSDIKGMDQTAYKYLNRNKALHKTPTIVSTPFLQVKFFHKNHFIARARKSNIAFGHFNSGVPIMNDKLLEKAVCTYSGKYKNQAFFGERSNPLSTAVGRTQYKKLVRRCLFNSLHRHFKGPNRENVIDKVSGVYFVQFFKVPVTQKDRNVVSRGFDKAIDSVISPKTQRKAADAAQGNGDTFKRLVTEVGRKNLPFIRQNYTKKAMESQN